MTQRTVTRRKIQRDSILFVFGLGGLAYQMISGEVNTALVIVCALMAGVPGAAGLVSLLLPGRDAGTTSPESSSPPGSSERSSSPTSST